MKNQMKQQEYKRMNCEQRIRGELKQVIGSLKKLYKLYLRDPELSDPDLGNLTSYGLDFSYVEAEDGEEDYFLWQISTGGPGDEFRFYVNSKFNPYRVEYWFLDWFDGASVTLRGKSLELLCNIWDAIFANQAPYIREKNNNQ